MHERDFAEAWLEELRSQSVALKDIAQTLRFLLGIAATEEGERVEVHPEHETPQ
ncbi:MAG: hypothetical protein ACM3W4_02120 [Ignavibacteriales bacterium]